MPPIDADLVVHRGGCHCGRVRFEVEAPRDVEVLDCNCTICRKSGYLHLIVPQACFRLRQGREALTEYAWGTGAARHWFCSVCGIKSFYRPRSNPEGIDVNLRCLDEGSLGAVTIRPFEGRSDWDAQAAAIVDLSR